ncbi:MAG: DEAD/DEAH box helicase [Candidatus Bathyarchaeota archaeon]
MADFVSHPLVKTGSVERRHYQDNIVEMCLKGNTLVVIPTGLGKTFIAALVAAHRLQRYSEGRCFMLAPTKPLILQHARVFESILKIDEKDFCIFTGEIPPSKRRMVEARAAFLTPQVLENDLIAGRVSLEDVALLIVDEAHRAVGNHSYVFISEQYMQKSHHPLILALTASPGSSKDKIDEVMRNLGIRNVEARSDTSLDVKPYVMPIKIEWCPVEFNSVFKKIQSNLESFIAERIKAVKKVGFCKNSLSNRLTFKDFIQTMNEIQGEIAKYSTPPQELRQTLLDMAAAKRISYALELLETQGLTPLKKYFKKLENLSKRRGVSSAAKKY